jgi:hypothetical protein
METKANKSETFTEKLTFSPGPKIHVFKIFVVIFSFLTTVWSAYFAAFGFPETTGWLVGESLIEIFFLFDMFLNFMLRYLEEDFNEVKDIRQIAKKYLKGMFF